MGVQFRNIPPAGLIAISLTTFVACGADVGPTETIRNDVSITTDLNDDPLVDANGDPVTVTLTLESLQLRFRGEGSIDHGDPSGEFGASIISSALAPDADVTVDPLDCGIYDVRFTDDQGRTCEFVVTEDAPNGGVFLCFVGSVWPLANHVAGDTCTDLFPEVVPPE